MPFTFFVRCDNQICDLYGSPLAIYEQHQKLWDDMRSAGNEFGWHPHLYRSERSCYVPIRSPREGVEILWTTWEAVRTLSFQVQCVRLGEAWHSSETMRALDEMKLRIDSTAVPGRRRCDEARSFDWESTPNRPYHPKANDYRVPGSGELEILEVPMTTASIKTSYDNVPLRRYLNFAYHEDLFQEWLRNYLCSVASTELNHLVIICHPDEFLERPSNPLYSYDFESFRMNLQHLQDVLLTVEQPFRFCVLSDVLTLT